MSLDVITKNWVWITALFITGGAWGQAQVKIQNLEDAVKLQAESQAQIQIVKEQAARLEERTVQIQSSQQRIETMMFEILRSQRALGSVGR